MLYSKMNPKDVDLRLVAVLKYTDAEKNHLRPQEWRAAIYSAPSLPARWVRRVR